MIVEKISYQKVFPIAPYINEKIGVEIQIDEHDIPGEALTHAKELVEQWHKESNPELYQTVPTASLSSAIPEIPIEKQIPEDQRLAIMIADLMKCKTLEGDDGLLTFKNFVDHANKPDITAAYNLMLKKLS